MSAFFLDRFILLQQKQPHHSANCGFCRFTLSLTIALTDILGMTAMAIAEGVAHVLAGPASCPVPYLVRRLVSVKQASLVTGIKHRGEFLKLHPGFYF